MKDEILIDSLFKHESEKIEYKSRFGKETIISLTAFANTSGGTVVVGVDDTHKIIGVNISKETEQKLINQIKNSTYPQLIPNIDIKRIKGKNILFIHIAEYPIKPVAYKKRYYKRVKNSNHNLSLDEIVNLQMHSLNISFDSYPVNSSVAELEQGLIEKYFEKIKSKGRIYLDDDLITNLIKMKLIKNDKPTLAASLMFGSAAYSIHCGRFKEKDEIIDDVLIKEPLMRSLEEVFIFIKKHINLSYSFNGRLERDEHWQYPLDIIRELLLNAIIHRDYQNTSDITIKIFDDKIIFINPGKLYGNITIADLNKDDYISSIRNKLLAESFYLLGEIEKYGTGFIRIRRILKKKNNLGFKIEEKGNYFVAQLFIKTPVKKLSRLEKDILNEIVNNNEITYNELSKKLDIGYSTVKEYIKRLKVKQLLKRHGAKRSGYWEIID